MKNLLSIVLIIAALIFGYVGITKLDESSTTVNILGIKISAEEESKKETGYIFLAGAAICLVAGIASMRNK